MKLKLKIRSFVFKAIAISLLTLVLLEFCYRFQLVDFYKTEWTFLNKEVDRNASNNSILIFGDSFSSASNNWVDELRLIDSSTSYYNSSMPGVATETYRLICKNRVKEVNPKKVIVQLYVGNDLYDIQKPIRWSQFSFSRNLFWAVSNYFRSLNFINYRMGQVSQDVVSGHNPKEEVEFSPKLYSQRTKLYIESIPNYPRDLIEIECQDVFQKMVNHLKEMEANTENSEFTILLIPHCSQVSTEYQKNYRELGSLINNRLDVVNFWEKKLLEEGFQIINPLEHFQELEMKGTHLYYQNDPHLNSLGQKVLANFVNTNLVEK